MKFASAAVLACAATLAHAAAWSFTDATLTIQSKGAGVGGAVKEKFSASSPLASPIPFAPADTLKVVLTATDNKTPARPHQAFLTLVDPNTGLADSFAFDVRDTGKAKVDVAYKDIPTALLSAQYLLAKLTLASFGATTPLQTQSFSLAMADAPASATADATERYAPQDEIHHAFKAAPRSPPVVITAVFALAVLAMVPMLLGAWAGLGMNLSHAGEALGKAPLAYTLFLGSLVGIEGVLVAYYVSWTLFQLLPAVLVLGVVGGVSGSRALREVQARRLAGKR